MKEKLDEQFFSKLKTKYTLNKERTETEGLISLKLEILCANILSEEHKVKAGLCMRVAWVNRIIGNIEEEHRFLEHALEEYKKNFETNRDETQTGNIMHMIAELNCRLDNHEEAKKWYSQLFQKRNVDRVLLDQVRDR